VVGYKFYFNDPIKGFQLVGVLPERRRDPDRITEESILNWGRQYFRCNFNSKEVFFVKVEMDEK
jgi:hypothetical protein